jgi:hypothetical protein
MASKELSPLESIAAPAVMETQRGADDAGVSMIS